MLNFCILFCIIFTSATVKSSVPINDIKIDLFHLLSPNENQFKQLMSETETFIDSSVYKTATLAMNFIPLVAKLVPLISFLENNLGNTIEDKLNKVVPRIVRKEIVKSDYEYMKTSINVINSNLGRLKKPNFDLQNKISMKHDIQNELEKILLTLAEKDGVREYATFSIPILFMLVAIVTIYEPMVLALNPVLAYDSQIACDLKNVLLEYRANVALDRMRSFEVKGPDSESFYIDGIFNAMKHSAVPMESMSNFEIKCHKSCEAMLANICVKDPLNDQIYSNNKDQFDSKRFKCFQDYMSVARKNVEEAFEKPINFISKVCSDSAAHGNKSGQLFIQTLLKFFGFILSIHFLGMDQLSLIIRRYEIQRDASGSSCDTHSMCDIYIKIFINGKLAHQTVTISGEDKAIPFTKFISKGILKTSTIRFELWDDDSDFFLDGEDDLMQSWDTSINEILRDGLHYFDDEQFIEVAAFWRGE